mgnify:CR=1 FL=1
MGIIDFFLNLLSDPRGAIAGWIITLGAVWVYTPLFLIVFVETGLVFFPFLPGDSLLFAAGVFSADGGGLHLGATLLVFYAAAILGNTSNYWIARFFGKRIIDSGELGAPLMIHACHRNVSQPDGFQTEMGVSNVAIHELDICRWLLGDEYESAQVLKVRQSACSTKGYDNPQIVLLETKSGARIDVEVQVADAYGYDIQCQVVCEKGTVNLPDPYAVVKRANASRSFPILTDWKDRFIEAYDIELTHWVKTLEEKGEPDGPSAWDGYAACVAADALNRSRGTGRFLPVETMEKPELYR